LAKLKIANQAFRCEIVISSPTHGLSCHFPSLPNFNYQDREKRGLWESIRYLEAPLGFADSTLTGVFEKGDVVDGGLDEDHAATILNVWRAMIRSSLVGMIRTVHVDRREETGSAFVAFFPSSSKMPR